VVSHGNDHSIVDPFICETALPITRAVGAVRVKVTLEGRVAVEVVPALRV
jgi:hypothetical protein